jgi:dihydropyrimidinase
MRTLITNGTVVTAADTVTTDILIDGERIAALGAGLGPADRTIDASGRYVFPGGIDEHTHFGLPVSGTVSAPWETESVAAALGGTTTVIDFAMQTRGETLSAGIRDWMENRAAGHSAVDYGFHITLVDLNPAVIEEIPDVVAMGVSTIKCLMAYKGTVMVDDQTLFRTLQVARDVGALVMVHCENGDVVATLQRELVEAGCTEPRFHPISRPPQCEGEATHRAIALAGMAGAPLFVVHVTAAQAAEEIRAARARGLRVYGETCPQYLTLTEEKLAEPDFEGAKWVCSPPLRPVEHRDILWDALADGTLQGLGSDHCAFTTGQKALGRGDFRLIPNGIPAAEERLPILYAHGVAAGRISLERFVDIVSTSPAKIMGLYPRKGTIAPGSDADLVLFDPEPDWTMTAGTQHSGIDYSPFEGLPMKGTVETVLLRGRPIVEKGRYVGALGQGQYIPRHPYAQAYGPLTV